MGKTVGVNHEMAIFVTMNPEYAGRSHLPDNLKQLFRPLAMTHPDRRLIAQVCAHSLHRAPFCAPGMSCLEASH